MADGSGVCPPAGLGFGGGYYSVVNGVCTRDGSFFGGKPVLSEAVGYAVVLGFGAFFALFTSFLVPAYLTPLTQSWTSPSHACVTGHFDFSLPFSVI
jgi:hypothetical protein